MRKDREFRCLFEQLFKKLRQAQLIKSVRGPGGGYLHAREASTMLFSDITAAVDEPLRATRCAPGVPAWLHWRQRVLSGP